MSTDLPPALPHGPIEEIFPDVFVVRGSFPFGPLVSIARNMTILRRGTELTLLNSVRLTDDGEAALAKLGTVKNLVRLGAAHGSDDAYMMQRYQPRFFAPARMRHKEGVAVDALVSDGEELPFGARAFCFKGGNVDELALTLDVDGGVLITCDALQNWTTREGCSFVGGWMMIALGFMEPAKVGPMWLKHVTSDRPARLKADFERLLTLPFQHLLSGHGSPLKSDAKDKVAASVKRVFG